MIPDVTIPSYPFLQDLLANPYLVDLVPPLEGDSLVVREPPKAALGLPRIETYDGELFRLVGLIIRFIQPQKECLRRPRGMDIDCNVRLGWESVR